MFTRLTQGDLEEVKHAIELLDTRTGRLQKTQRSAAATSAGLSRRIKALEKILAGAVSPVEVLDGEEEALDDTPEEEEDIETRRLKLRLENG